MATDSQIYLISKSVAVMLNWLVSEVVRIVSWHFAVTVGRAIGSGAVRCTSIMMVRFTRDKDNPD
jgi:hypothetical protein